MECIFVMTDKILINQLFWVTPAFREIFLLKRLRHRNVIRLYDVLYSEEKQKIYPFEHTD